MRFDEVEEENGISIPTFKKYIAYCRRFFFKKNKKISSNQTHIATKNHHDDDFYCSKCLPSLSEETGSILVNQYVDIRSRVRKQDQKSKDVIPITVRQLEAIIRFFYSQKKKTKKKDLSP